MVHETDFDALVVSEYRNFDGDYVVYWLMNLDDLVAYLHFVGILGNEMNDDGPYLADEKKNNACDVTRCAPSTVKDYSDISLDCQNNQHAELADVNYVAGGYDSAMS